MISNYCLQNVKQFVNKILQSSIISIEGQPYLSFVHHIQMQLWKAFLAKWILLKQICESN